MKALLLGSNSENRISGSPKLIKQVILKVLKEFRIGFYIGCITSLILVIVVGLVSYNALNRQQQLEKWVEHTYQVLRKTDSLNTFFNQAALTDGNTYSLGRAGLTLQNHENIVSQINSLQQLVSYSPPQQQQIHALQQQITELWQTSAQNSKQFRLQFEKIATTIIRIKQTEEDLLVAREKAYKRSGRQTQVIIVTGSGLILIIVAILIYIILKELNNRSLAYQKEHELNQLKSTFVTMASHEFRTPLSSILLSATLIDKYLERGENISVVKHLAKIKQVVYNLEGILEDFLSLEKLEEGGVSAEFTLFDLRKLCQDVINVQSVMKKPQQLLIYEHSGPEMVYLDQTLIKSSLNSLLSNAIKYAGEDACIRLNTCITANSIVLSVRDNGVGIAEEDQKKLTTMFYRIHNTGHISGTGLGLHIVKHYVELMKGTLEVSSTPYEETCFTMTFPTK